MEEAVTLFADIANSRCGTCVVAVGARSSRLTCACACPAQLVQEHCHDSLPEQARFVCGQDSQERHPQRRLGRCCATFLGLHWRHVPLPAGSWRELHMRRANGCQGLHFELVQVKIHGAWQAGAFVSACACWRAAANPSEACLCLQIFHHITCATDTNNVSTVFNACREIILQENIRGSGFM